MPGKTTKPPTELEIEHALDVISRAAKARKARGQDRPRDRAFHRYREKKQMLAAECDETAQSLYQHIADALSDNRKELVAPAGELSCRFYDDGLTFRNPVE